MYLKPNNKYWAIDIEGDPIPSTVVYCLCAENIVTGEKWESSNTKDIYNWISARQAEGCKFVAHNIIGYDAPTLNRLLGTRLGIADLVDTMLMSMVYSPSINGGHGLEAWGIRIGSPKLDFHDFSRFTPEMLVYCRQDTHLCRLVYRTLILRMTKQKFTDFGIDIEHRSWSLIQQQKKTGFAFNIREAHVLFAKLNQYIGELQDRVYEVWPPVLKKVNTYAKPYKKDGSESANYRRHCDEFDEVRLHADRNGYDVYAFVSFNIGSPDQRVEKLLELGWKPYPNERTPTGQPKPTHKGKLVPSLVKFVEESGQEGPRLIAQWMDLKARSNMINNWIESFNENTGCIHGSLWLANTLRYRHSEPNSANIPAVRVIKDENGVEHPLLGREGAFTYEARDLWVTRDPVHRRLVGVDAKGIQLRVLAHYLNNPDFSEAVLNGDPHSYNQKIGGFATRAIAKTFIYAFLLGSGDEKTGQIIGGTPRDGKDIKAKFIGNFPGLAELLDSLGEQVDRTGRIILCDGTPLIVREPHTRLGYLLQGDESRIMKLAAILTNQEVKKRKLDVLKVGDIHDEWQNDVLLEHVSPFKDEVCPKAFATAGETFRYRVPIACDSKVGLTWAETH